MKFKLDSRLQADSYLVSNLSLCQVRLINDSQFVWCVLVPKVFDAVEIIDLNGQQQAQLWQESALLSHVLKRAFSPHKLNVAAIGNIVSQLHVHHVCRYTNDVAWPAPVWGKQAMIHYSEDKKLEVIEKIQGLLAEHSV